MPKHPLWMKILAGLIVAVMGWILFPIIGAPIQDAMDTPVAQPSTEKGRETFCPTYFNYPPSHEKLSSFSVKLQNVGDDGNLFVTFSSDVLSSRSKSLDVFSSESTETRFVNQKKYQDFTFDVKSGDDIPDVSNFTVHLEYGCAEPGVGSLQCTSNRHCCRYQQQDNVVYRLASEVCV